MPRPDDVATFTSMSETDVKLLKTKLKNIGVLGSVAAILGWDEQVNLPPASGQRRGEQQAAIAAAIHASQVEPELGEVISRLEANMDGLSGDDRVIVRWARRDYDLATRLPEEFVRRKAALESEGYHIWRKARADNDFNKFAPVLERQVALLKEEADLQGKGDKPYDYLLDQFDPGLTEDDVEKLFGSLRAGLVPFVQEIVSSPIKARPELLKGLPVAGQDRFLREVITAIGFDFSRGRMDVAVHPFCSGDAADTRLTTRFSEDEPLTSLFGAIHEAGHGLYEQGLPVEHHGNALGESVGMAVHESQSRTWENQVGRSRQFWKHFEPRFREVFGDRLNGVSSDELFLAANAVALTPIRVEADEVTYNLHIILRFEIERRLFSGALKVDELPAAWNALTEELLGFEPENDQRGILQDVHWSGGAFGYFPSYCIGNMVAAQFWKTVRQEIPGLQSDFERGEFGRLLDWVRTNVHSQGRRYQTKELVKRVTGEELSPSYLLEYLRERFVPIYLPETR